MLPCYTRTPLASGQLALVAERMPCQIAAYLLLSPSQSAIGQVTVSSSGNTLFLYSFCHLGPWEGDWYCLLAPGAKAANSNSCRES